MATDKPTTFIQLCLHFNEKPEEWRPVVGWEGLYEVSNLGRVRSLDRLVIHSNGRRQHRRGVILKGYTSRYCMIVLYDIATKRKQFVLAHRLVLAAFVGPLPPGRECNHKDRNGTNNRLENLEYVTQLENSQHKYATGNINLPVGEAHHRALLTEDSVREIRRLRQQGMTYAAIGALFDVKEDTIRNAALGKSWKHVKD